MSNYEITTNSHKFTCRGLNLFYIQTYDIDLHSFQLCKLRENLLFLKINTMTMMATITTIGTMTTAATQPTET